MKRIPPFISITSGRLSVNNMALCALRAIDFFSQNIMLRMTQTYVIINRNNCRLILFLQMHVHFATILQVTIMSCFWIIVPRAITRRIYSSASMRNSTNKARVAWQERWHVDMSLRHWRSCRSAGGPSAVGNGRARIRGKTERRSRRGVLSEYSV